MPLKYNESKEKKPKTCTLRNLAFDIDYFLKKHTFIIRYLSSHQIEFYNFFDDIQQFLDKWQTIRLYLV